LIDAAEEGMVRSGEHTGSRRRRRRRRRRRGRRKRRRRRRSAQMAFGSTDTVHLATQEVQTKMRTKTRTWEMHRKKD
jgi:hypothetical protein